MKFNHKHTIFSCYIGYLTQGIAINLAPLLFTTFQGEYGLTLADISILIAISFVTQLLTDFSASVFIKIFGKRACSIAAHVFAAFGLIGFALFPAVIPSAYLGMIIAVIFCGIGGGMIEVLISPIVEACPSDNKEAAMSLLHSFYSWGQAGVILLSTIFFATVGIDNWRFLACLWAIIPLSGAFMFSFVPLYSLPAESAEKGENKKSFLKSSLFWVIFIMMLCAGASEMTMSQWASTFAETGLGVDKSVGDLLGPCLFAILMGVGRIFYARFSDRINSYTAMFFCSCMCIISYLLAALSPWPILALVGCALCGLSVSILWPGTISIAAKKIPTGGISMFALIAFAGDVGCLVGPSSAGSFASAFGNDLTSAFLLSLVFPATLILMVGILKKKK